MVTKHHKGQAATEFVLMLAILTGIGIFIVSMFTNQGQNAIGVAQTQAVQSIASD